MEYRILQEGEIIQEGDEVDISQHLNEEPVWVKTTCAGQKAPNPLYPAHRVYRRPTQRALDDAEVCDCGEKFPESGYCRFCGARSRHRQ